MVNNVSVEVAMQHNDSYSDNTYGFVNNITTPEGRELSTNLKLTTDDLQLIDDIKNMTR